MILSHDRHVRSNYSNGRPLPFVLAAAEEAGLERVGIADHCNVPEREAMVEARRE